jgi:hypothetical protein
LPVLKGEVAEPLCYGRIVEPAKEIADLAQADPRIRNGRAIYLSYLFSRKLLKNIDATPHRFQTQCRILPDNPFSPLLPEALTRQVALPTDTKLRLV